MKRHLLLTLGLVLPSVAAFGQTYSIDPAHSASDFSVKHMMISNVQGEFSGIKGTVVYDAGNLKGSSVKATIDTTTLNTNDPDRDKHLKSPDFFDIATYPTMTFESTEFVEDGGKLQVKGNLTLHGVTKAVVLDIADGPSPEMKDPWGNLRRGVSASTIVHRQDYGLIWNKALDGGGVLVGDDVKITLNIEGLRKP
jgi:polyisoprenoid-binding protein YceI